MMLLVGYRVGLFNNPMSTRNQVDYMLRDVWGLGKEEMEETMVSAHRTGMG